MYRNEPRRWQYYLLPCTQRAGRAEAGTNDLPGIFEKKHRIARETAGRTGATAAAMGTQFFGGPGGGGSDGMGGVGRSRLRAGA
jgi:hypothetical protein